MSGKVEGLVDPFAVGDLLYRIDTYGLSAGLNDGDFRSNVQPILEDVRGLLSGMGYSVQPERLECPAARALIGEWMARRPHAKATARGTLVGCAMELEAAIAADAQSVAAGGEVDDAMVERACIAYYEEPAWAFMSHKAGCLERMRAALTAALATQHGDNT